VSKSIELLKRLFNRKPGFWVFQFGGWIVFLLIEYFQSPGKINSFKSFFFWIGGMLFGFLITLILRVIYRRIYNKSKNLFLISLVMSISTLIAGTTWFLLNTMVAKPILSTLLNGMEFQVALPAMSDIIRMALMLGWPFFGWSVLYFGIKFWQDLLDEKQKSEKSVLLAQQAQLQMLRYQLNPHFLFNSLNSIQALIYINPQDADKMLTDLSEFLRFSLVNKDKIFTPLKDEILMIRKYLSMEKTRFPNRLEYSIEVSDQALEQSVISFLLQPFVENAIKHGMRNNPDHFRITLKGEVRDHKLCLAVSNNGPWVEPDKEKGTGMQNVIDRLDNAYPGKYRFNLDKLADGVIITIEISLEDD
jgi:two-component system, LytTR family, sensor kinase